MGEEPPPQATASLQAYVSNLRRPLEPAHPPRTPPRVLVTQAERQRLEELRLVVLEDRLAAELACGGHGELVGRYPFRERLHGLLMLALYRSGRQAEALGRSKRHAACWVDGRG